MVAEETTNVSVASEGRGGSFGPSGWKVVNRYAPRSAPSTASLAKSTQPARSKAMFVRPLP